MGELLFRIREFFSFSTREKRDLLIATVVATFILAYNDRSEVFVTSKWLFNMVLTLAFVSISLIVHSSVQKVAALQQGFTAEFRCWPTGMALGIILTLLTGGGIYVLLLGGLSLTHVSILRIGKWRYGESVTARGLIAASGSVGNLILATIALTFSAKLGIMPETFGWLAAINFWMIFYSMLPIPRMDGIHLFFWSRLGYVFIFGTLAAYIILANFEIYSWILALLIGGVCWLLFLLYVEK